MTAYTLDQFSRMIDHTNLHADATHADLRQLYATRPNNIILKWWRLTKSNRLFVRNN